jgi:hypothetical protein
MRFGAPRAKLDLVADFAEALALGAFRVGDTLGLLAFDARERLDLMLPATRSRGIGAFIAERLRGCSSGPGGIEGLEKAALRLAGRPGLVFLASDFHWPLKRLGAVLDLLSPAFVVPLVVWDPAETEPPDLDAIATLSDAETGRRRTLWLNSRLRERWRDAVTQRRDELGALFKPRGLRPFYLSGRFNSEAMSRYFLEAAA